jgi:hypothetical protein
MKTGVKDYMRKVIKDEILAKFTEWRRRSYQFVPLAPHLAAPNAYMRHIDTACCLARVRTPSHHRFHEVFTSADPEGSGAVSAASYVSAFICFFACLLYTTCV